MDLYELLAQDYDALHPREAVFAQRPFFEGLIRDYGIRTALDCSCGTGWHLALLSDLGVACAGSDASVAMLALAGENLAGRGITLKQEDFRTLDRSWEERFDLIICMTTSFSHMLTAEDALAALRSMYDRLNPGGVLVLDSGTTDALLDARPKLIPARVLQDQAFYFFLEYPGEEQVIFNILHVKKTPEGFAHGFTAVPYNALRASVLERYFAQTAFAQVRLYGDFAGSVYSPKDSRRLIAVARKGV